MDTLNVAGYGMNGYQQTNSIQTSKYLADTAVSASSSNSSSETTNDPSSLGMNDFLQLMVAQMKNQDIMNPTDNTEFVSQMAQFSSLQAMTDMSKSITAMQSTIETLKATSDTQYAASLMGKKAYASFTDKDGKIVKKDGIINAVMPTSTGTVVTFKENPTEVVYLDEIYRIADAGEDKIPTDDKTDDDSEDKVPGVDESTDKVPSTGDSAKTENRDIQDVTNAAEESAAAQNPRKDA